MKNIYITSAIRTAVGSLGKSLKNINAEELGSAVISSAVAKSKLKTNDLDEIIMGQVLTGGSGQNPARQAAMKSGVPKEKPAYVVNQVCGSGIRSVASGFQSIKSGDSKILVAGGQENMSLAPHVIHLRDGKKLGDAELIDTMIKDGLWDAFNGYHMGITAENVAEKFQVTRDEQDKFALSSQEKALKAQKDGKFKDEIINLKIKSKKAELDFEKDEHPREGINLDALFRLKPVFKKDGTVTAGNASGINDGAAAVTLMTSDEAEKRNIEKFQQFIFHYAKSKACENNGWKSKTSISVGHEHIGFLHTFKRLQEFYVHMNDYRKNDKVIYITINTQEEADQRFLNNTNKNNPNNTDWERKSHFWYHRRIYKKVVEQKQSCDIILPMRYIYKKEYLREWLRKEFDWNDKCYDALYDAWYSKQDVIL